MSSDLRSDVRFTERMDGHVSFGQADYALGARAGRADGTHLAVVLTIRVDDLDVFAADPAHRAVATGHVLCDALGGRLAVERGDFQLFVDAGEDQREMRYRLLFRDGVGHPLTLLGVKTVRGRPILRAWRETTTLYTRVVQGHVGADEPAVTVASGVLRIRPLSFLKQLTTFRSDRPALAARLGAVARFGGVFAQRLWRPRRPENPA